MASARVTRSKRRRLAAPPPAAAAAANDGVLPTEMLLEVLLRLPAKELCRLRLVCREWRSLTSDPGFARAHSSRRRTLLVAGVCKRREEIKLADLLSGDVVKRIPVPEATVKYGHNLSMQAGYVCVSESDLERPCVVDVATGAVTFLPAGVAAEVEHVTMLVKVVKSTSMLGHVPSTGEYKVLRIHQCLKKDGVHCHKCDVTTLGGDDDDDGGWRARPDPPMCISGYFERRVVVGGVAYFLSNPYDGNTGSSESIASFDLATEAWRPAMLRGPLSSKAKSPDEMLMVNTRGRDLQLNELDGCLVTVHSNYQDCSTDLWFLVDADKKELWAKRYSVKWSSPDGKLNECKSFPLVVLDDGRIVVWIRREQALRAYDPKTCVWTDLAKVKDYFCMGMLKGNLMCSGLQG